MDRETRKTITCLDEALTRDDPSEVDRIILIAMRKFLDEQWGPHIELTEEKLTEIAEMQAHVKDMHTTFFTPMMELNGYEPENAPTLGQLLRKTAIRANVWFDAACWFVRYGWLLIGGALAGLIWLIRHHDLFS